ncbi:DUF6122 family protein [Neolewinella lacunae]|uniref:DUF6122 family protein n=1 Tax=Neolewinella lacunae TaxID=1517758 RepID=UPI001CA42018|nr:DUF6122 family protein [Neolewinella lacunae]MDN3633997.1 DUF6122 family protein [Neolewinella lacunae]
MQTFVHYFLHFGFPFFIAFFGFRKDWKRAYLLLLATMLVDLDHLLANPVFQTNRCSIHFHPLHTYYAMLGYMVLLFLRWPFRLIGIGLLFHMLTDLIDCLMMYGHCQECFADAPAAALLRTVGGALGM